MPSAVRRRLYHKLLPSNTFVDLSHDLRRTVLVAGSQRSGTTWLAALLVEAYHCRLVFEPLRNDHVADAVPCSFNRFVDPGQVDAELERYVHRALSGRVRSQWSDRWNTVRVARNRVVKEIGQNVLLPWIVNRFPQMPAVLVLRHPFTSAASAAELGWDARLTETLDQPSLVEGPLAPFAELVREYRSSPDPLLRHVLRWCVETVVPVLLLDPARVLVVFFEELSADPRREMARVGRYLEEAAPRRWKERPVKASALRRPSFTDWRSSAGATAEERFRSFEGSLGARLEEAVAMVSAFGLDRLYGAGPDPLVGPDEALGVSPGGAAGGRAAEAPGPDNEK